MLCKPLTHRPRFETGFGSLGVQSKPYKATRLYAVSTNRVGYHNITNRFRPVRQDTAVSMSWRTAQTHWQYHTEGFARILCEPPSSSVRFPRRTKQSLQLVLAQFDSKRGDRLPRGGQALAGELAG